MSSSDCDPVITDWKTQYNGCAMVTVVQKTVVSDRKTYTYYKDFSISCNCMSSLMSWIGEKNASDEMVASDCNPRL